MISKVFGFGLLALSWFGLGLPASASLVEARDPVEAQAASLGSASLSLNEWIAQSDTVAVAEIEDVRIETTPQGAIVTIVSSQPLIAGDASERGNALIIEIPNATLKLADAVAAEQFSPADGIALVQVSDVASGGVQIAITGTDAAPDVQISSEAGNLVVNVLPGVAQAGTSDEAIQLTVTGDGDEGYSPDAAAVTRLNTPILDTPASVQVVPRQVFEDQGISNFSEALRTVPGVSQSTAPNGNFNNVRLRGFNVSSPNLRNGVPESLGFSLPRDLSNVERLEVLSGPASIIGGQISPGGIVNIVTKQPLSSPFYEISASYGSFNRIESGLDLSGPLSEDLAYRLNASYFHTDTFVDVDEVDVDRVSIAPVLRWDISDQTKITFEGRYLNSETPQRVGIPASGTILDNPNGEISRDAFFGEPSFDGNNRQLFQIGYDLEHQFNDDWTLRNIFRYTRLESEQREAFLSGLQDDLRTIERRGSFFNTDFDNYQATAFVTGEFETGAVDHTLSAGIDFVTESESGVFERFEIENIDLFDPVFTGLGNTTSQGGSFATRKELGLYAQDQLSFFDDRLFLVLGGRFDFIESSSEDASDETSRTSQGDTAFSPRVGLLYKPVDNVSLYGSFSRSFQQETGRSADSELFEPSRGTQYEVGAKVNWLDGRLSTTLALFDLTQSNVLTLDPDNPEFDIQTGEQRSRGIELSTQGELTRGWNIVAAYTYTDAEITSDNALPVGNRLTNVPRNSASLFTKYTIPEGGLEGLGFGVGLFYVGEREANLANDLQLPSYFRTDAALTYERDNFNVGLNFRNLFDVDFIESGDRALRVNPGEPFNVQFSVSYEF